MRRTANRILAYTAAAILGFATAGAVYAQTGFTQTPRPTAGQCKAGPSVAFGQSIAQAQAIWTASVASQHGANWSLWMMAQDKKIFPTVQGGQQVFQAMAKPCYYVPQG